MKHFNENNLILKSDSYKYSQWKQYVAGSTSLFSYLESRGGQYPETVFFGLQYYIKKYLTNPITVENVEEAKLFFEKHGVDFNYEGWMYIAKDLHGRIPVRIRAVPEGTRVPVSNILMSVESTDPKVFWIVNWLETLLLKVWYPITVATQNSGVRQTILDALELSADDPKSEIEFKLHSFGYRGVSSEESAAIGGAAELLCSMGTDTLAGVVAADNYYDSGMCGFSINASEHSTITCYGKENEVEACRNMIREFGRPGAIFACVSDSFDIYNCITNIWGGALKDELLASGATLVIRPDSGVPEEVVPKCLALMDEKFGHTVNSKGYKVLKTVKLIQGDGMNPESIKVLLKAVMDAGYSISNLAIGMGGASLTGTSHNVINRDTQKFAFKASSITVNGTEHDVYKSPITDKGKVSKKGRLDLELKDGKYSTVVLPPSASHLADSAMRTVYENGELLVDDTFQTIRDRVNQ